MYLEYNILERWFLENSAHKNYFHLISSLTSSFRWRSFHPLQILPQVLLSGDQGDYSCSSEACQDHQKLN